MNKNGLLPGKRRSSVTRESVWNEQWQCYVNEPTEHYASPYAAHLFWIVYRVKKKQYKTMQHLCFHYKKPLRWMRKAKAEAIKKGLITEVEWKAAFRQPGRPRKGKPRGPYKVPKRGSLA